MAQTFFLFPENLIKKEHWKVFRNKKKKKMLVTKKTFSGHLCLEATSWL
jgi:hypothetical protein